VDGRSIRALGDGEPPPPEKGEARTQIDACGAMALPGMINTHHHLYQTFQRAVLNLA